MQPSPDGLAQAFIIGETSSARPSALVLGDNIFYGQDCRALLLRARARERAPPSSPTMSRDPERYGVVEFDRAGGPSRSRRSPQPRSNWAVTGLYFYDNEVVRHRRRR